MAENILNIQNVELQPRPAAFAPKGAAAEKYDARMGFIAQKLGAQKLGCNITVIPAGKRAFPHHNHRYNEELFFILDGTGHLRFGDEQYEIRAGDVICCPAGGPETAHQLINTSDSDLKFLAISTKLSPEIAEYPDTGKFGILAEYPPTPSGEPQGLMFVGRPENSEDYWEGA
jgi:uncharacterized cupin superfamily protein